MSTKTIRRALSLAMIPLALAAAPASAQPAAGAAEPPQAAPPPPDETREETLERLHAALAAAAEQDAERIAREIQGVWARSGSDSMDLLLNRGRNAMEREDFEAARAHLSAVTRLAPDFAEGWNALATLSYLQKDYGAAVAYIERVLALEPRHFSALTGLALSLEVVGRKDAAMQAWRRVEALYPTLENAQEGIERLSVEVEGRSL